MASSLSGLLLWRATREDSSTTTCLICLECPGLPNLQDVRSITLQCGHTFCRDCIGQYVETKVRDRHVERDQLVCPVIECRRSLGDPDLRLILATTDAFDHYKRTLRRVRDEQNPRARWCPRAECSALIVCKSSRAKTFTCPTCATVGCFHCRGLAHARDQQCDSSPIKTTQHDDYDVETPEQDVDALYLQWEQSLEQGHADSRPPVRPCPKCRMRIWKNEGCNHMTCSHCRHEYCWVCDANWYRGHYTCGAMAARRHGPVRRPSTWLNLVVWAGREAVGLVPAAFGISMAIARTVRPPTAQGRSNVVTIPRDVRPIARIIKSVWRGLDATLDAALTLVVFVVLIVMATLAVVYVILSCAWAAAKRVLRNVQRSLRVELVAVGAAVALPSLALVLLSR